MAKKYDMNRVLHQYDWAKWQEKKLGTYNYFMHADEPHTMAHDVQQTLARTSSIILADLQKEGTE